MRCPLKKILAMSLLSIGLATAANAAFIDESSANPFSSNTRVKILGAVESKVIHGFAQDLNLIDAVRQITPSGYQVRLLGDQQVGNRKVSWRGGKDWAQVLRDMIAAESGVSALIDADSKVVVISNEEINDADVAGRTVSAVSTTTGSVLGRTDSLNDLRSAVPTLNKAGSPKVSAAALEHVNASIANPRVIVERGSAPVEIPDVRGQGVSIPVGVALTAVIPQEFQILTPSDVSLSVPVSWQGGRAWRTVLNEVLLQAQLTAHIDWDSRSVSIERSMPTVTKNALEGHLDDLGHRQWEIYAGESMRDTLARWGSAMNWQIAWEAETDYMINAGATLDGSFKDAVEQVIRAVNSSGNTIIRATFYRNNVVRVYREE